MWGAVPGDVDRTDADLHAGHEARLSRRDGAYCVCLSASARFEAQRQIAALDGIVWCESAPGWVGHAVWVH